jgi:PIN domain nuclease of toxin-antitoxin system
MELQFQSEVGRIALKRGAFLQAPSGDGRFVIDEVPLMSLVQTALPLDWTRDPFDRLLSAHSTTRRVPPCSVARTMLRHHATIVAPLRSDRNG